MNTSSPVSQPGDLRRRLRELLSIPERDRTEEQWDEIVELEIQLAPGNRIGPGGDMPSMKSGPSTSGGGNQQQRKHRPSKNPGGGGGSGGGGGGGGGGGRRPKTNKPPRDPSA